MSLMGLALSTPDDPYNACQYGVTTHPLYHRCDVCKNANWCEYGLLQECLKYAETCDAKHLHCTIGLDNPDHNATCQYCYAKDKCPRYFENEPLDLDETRKLLKKLNIT